MFINSAISDGDIKFRGNDGGSFIIPLTLDMSEGGAATFNSGMVVNEGSNDSDFRVESDSNTHMLFVDAGNNRVGIGDSAPNVALSVVTSGSNEQFHVESPTPGMKFIDSNLTTRCFTIGGENGNVDIHADPNTASSDSHILMKADGSTIARFDGDGLKFGTDTAAANALDDYEEGTFTSTITPETSGTITLNSSFDLVSYTKVGQLVHVAGALKVTSVSSPVGNHIQINLPFTIAGLGELSSRGTASVTFVDANASTYTASAVTFNASQSYVRVHIDASTIQTNDEFYLGITYPAA
jgi:hypothetical protein